MLWKDERLLPAVITVKRSRPPVDLSDDWLRLLLQFEDSLLSSPNGQSNALEGNDRIEGNDRMEVESDSEEDLMSLRTIVLEQHSESLEQMLRTAMREGRWEGLIP